MEKFEVLKKKGRFGPEDLNSLDLGMASPKIGENNPSESAKTPLNPIQEFKNPPQRYSA